ncbi:MAG: hypothetical protein JRE24_08825 [Deltaproteobacteria bacterium]|nr:hypothetical protein [Deltaproteobacteria bacterium]MBW2566962.1 hypothetical protein [Deltaproteobacteria bacterium]
MCADDSISELLNELSDAKMWPERFRQAIDSGSDVSGEINEAGKAIETLEKRAQETMKRLGCDCPDTRKISQGMIDMLINWYTFEDSLGPKMLNVAGKRLSASDD